MRVLGPVRAPSDSIHLEVGSHAVIDVSSAYSMPRYQAAKIVKVTDKTVHHSNTFSSRSRVVFVGNQLECDALAAVLRESVAEEWKASLALREANKETRKRLIDQAKQGQQT